MADKSKSHQGSKAAAAAAKPASGASSGATQQPTQQKKSEQPAQQKKQEQPTQQKKSDSNKGGSSKKVSRPIHLSLQPFKKMSFGFLYCTGSKAKNFISRSERVFISVCMRVHIPEIALHCSMYMHVKTCILQVRLFIHKQYSTLTCTKQLLKYARAYG